MRNEIELVCKSFYNLFRSSPTWRELCITQIKHSNKRTSNEEAFSRLLEKSKNLDMEDYDSVMTSLHFGGIKDSKNYQINPKNFEFDIPKTIVNNQIKFASLPSEFVNNLSSRNVLSNSERTERRRKIDYIGLEQSYFWIRVIYCQKQSIVSYSCNSSIQINNCEPFSIQTTIKDYGTKGTMRVFNRSKVNQNVDFEFTTDDLCEFVLTSDISKESFSAIWKHLFHKRVLIPYHNFEKIIKAKSKESKSYLFVVLGEMRNEPIGYFFKFDYCVYSLFEENDFLVDTLVRNEFAKNPLKKVMDKFISKAKKSHLSFEEKIKANKNERLRETDKQKLIQLKIEREKLEKEKKRYHKCINELKFNKSQNIFEYPQATIRNNAEKYDRNYQEYLKKDKENPFDFSKVIKLHENIGTKKVLDVYESGILLKISKDEHKVFGDFRKQEHESNAENLMIISSVMSSRPNMERNSFVIGSVFAKDKKENYDRYLKRYSEHVDSYLYKTLPKIFSIPSSTIVHNVDGDLHGTGREIIGHANQIALLSKTKIIERHNIQIEFRRELVKEGISKKKIENKSITITNQLNFKNKKIDLFVEKYPNIEEVLTKKINESIAVCNDKNRKLETKKEFLFVEKSKSSVLQKNQPKKRRGRKKKVLNYNDEICHINDDIEDISNEIVALQDLKY